MCESCDNELSRIQTKTNSYIEFSPIEFSPKYKFEIICKKIILRWQVFDLKDGDWPGDCEAEMEIELYGNFRDDPNRKIYLEKTVPCDKTWGTHRVFSLTYQ